MRPGRDPVRHSVRDDGSGLRSGAVRGDRGGPAVPGRCVPTRVQLDGPDHRAARGASRIRGRALGLFGMAQMGLQVGSGVTVGVLGAVIGVHWSLGLSALALTTGTVVLLAFYVRRNAPRPTEAAYGGLRELLITGRGPNIGE